MTRSLQVGRRCGIVALALMVAVSCSDGDTVTSPTSPTQLDGTWRLFQMTTSAGVHNEDLNAGRFTINLSTTTIQVKADCNTCSGPASLSGELLTLGPLACTVAACSSAPIDTRYSGLLTGTVTARVNNRLLQFNNAAGAELRFQK